MAISNTAEPTRGVLYVAAEEDKYVEEAFLSADSIKERFPDLSICLFTDRPSHPLCSTDRFDRVERTSDVSDFHLGRLRGSGPRWSEGLLGRLLCLRRTPYDYTLHIDTDTQVVTDELGALFTVLDDIDVAMVETSIDDSYSRFEFGRPMFNGGLVLYRRNELTWVWLREWAALSERNLRWAGLTPLPRLGMLSHLSDDQVRRDLMRNDQLSLAEILSPEVNKFGLKLRVLDYSWNYRGSRLPERNLTPPRILHLPRERVTDYASRLEGAIHWALVRMS